MFALMLLIPSAASDDVAAFRLAASPLKITCVSTACNPRPRKDDYRIPAERDPLAMTSKQRAIAADGTDCTVIGDKYCTSNGHTVFSTDFGQ